MSEITVYPTKLKGCITPPPSKSIAHRAVLAAAFGDGCSRISGLQYSQDIKATMSAVEALGANVSITGSTAEIDGTLNKKNKKRVMVDCAESGSTLRFLIPPILALGIPAELSGRGKLPERPLTVYEDIMNEQGIYYKKQNGGLPLTIDGKLKPGRFSVAGNISSQFITGLLYALPMLSGNSTIEITTEIESAGYIEITLSTLAAFGIYIKASEDLRQFEIPGNQRYKSHSYTIESDYSQAAFFLSAAALGNDLKISGLSENSLQGDRQVVEILRRMGAVIKRDKDSVNVSTDGLCGTIIDASSCPDIIPALAPVAAVAEGTTHIVGAGRLRIKECDRLHAIVKEFSALGADVTEYSDEIVFVGKQKLSGGVAVSAHGDHRMAMTLAVAATICENPITIDNAQCVEKSYPEFWEDYKRLGGIVK